MIFKKCNFYKAKEQAKLNNIFLGVLTYVVNIFLKNTYIVNTKFLLFSKDSVIERKIGRQNFKEYTDTNVL